MLAYNYYHLNITLEDYEIESMTPKNDSEMEKHSARQKIQGFEFIILSRYIVPESTTTITMVTLKDDNNKNF